MKILHTWRLSFSDHDCNKGAFLCMSGSLCKACSIKVICMWFIILRFLFLDCFSSLCTFSELWCHHQLLEKCKYVKFFEQIFFTCMVFESIPFVSMFGASPSLSWTTLGVKVWATSVLWLSFPVRVNWFASSIGELSEMPLFRHASGDAWPVPLTSYTIKSKIVLPPWSELCAAVIIVI